LKKVCGLYSVSSMTMSMTSVITDRSGVRDTAPVMPFDAADAADADADACYICLESGGPGDKALAAHVCACLTSRVHVRCVEIMVNSTARRAKPLAERTACPVCAQPYTIDFAPYLIDVTGQHPCRKWAMSDRGRLVLQCAAMLVAMGLVAAVGSQLSPALSVLVVGVVGAVLGIATLVFKARQYGQKTNDDNVFYARAVAQARRSVDRGHRCPAEEAAAADPARVILVAQGRLAAHTVHTSRTSDTRDPPAPADAGTSPVAGAEADTAPPVAADADVLERRHRRSSASHHDPAMVEPRMAAAHVVVEIALSDRAADLAAERRSAERDVESTGAS
jgi:hypothetical protein